MSSDTEGKQKIFNRHHFKLPAKTSRVIERVRDSCLFRALPHDVIACVAVISLDETGIVTSHRTKKERTVGRNFVRALFKHLYWSDPLPTIPPHLF
jgi:hypothetical protein